MDLLETIKKLSESEKFEELLSQMKRRASSGKITGVTEEMIDNAYKQLFNENTYIEERELLPFETINLFMQVEEAVSAFSNDNYVENQTEILSESDIFNSYKESPKENILENLKLSDFLGGLDE